jgi:hypothetical protein
MPKLPLRNPQFCVSATSAVMVATNVVSTRFYLMADP